MKEHTPGLASHTNLPTEHRHAPEPKETQGNTDCPPNPNQGFTLPEGYVAWCHICAEPPFNLFTEIEMEISVQRDLMESQLPPGRRRVIRIPGMGFKSMLELSKHTTQVHREWKG